MALPTKQKTWVIDPCNRITFSSLVQTMREYLFQIKEFLKANGYTIKGSCDGTTGAMDTTDRWDSAIKAGVRGANTTTANSWVVLVDGSGCNILLSYVGASDDICRISFSPGGNYVAAGTANQTPTATDERIITSATTVINATASADRLWSGWVSSDAKMCRFTIARSGVWTGQTWGVEIMTPVVVSPAVFSPATWGFCYNNGNLTVSSVAGANAFFSANVKGGVARVTVSSVAIDITVGGTGESIADGTGGSVGKFNGVLAELQGGSSYPMARIGCSSGTTGARGKLGNRIDWWTGRSTGATDGDTYGTLEFIQIGEIAWPWDGVTTPVLT